MLSDFRFSRGGVLGRMLGLLMFGALLFVAGCAGSGNSVTIGPPAQLAFTGQPTSASAGNSIAPAVTVSIEDAQGHVVTTATNQVTLTIGTNPSAGTMAGTATATAVAGVATFSNLSINNPGTGYTLAASTAGLTGATSGSFNVFGAAAKLAFTVQPASVAAGISIAPAVAVSVEDAAGNVVATATNQITIAIGTNPSSGTLSGTAQVNAVAGVATFSTLNLNKVGTGYTLAASASGLTSATSSAFNVTAGAAAKLAFTAQPTNTTAGVAISPAVQITVQDSQGNTVTTATNQITIAIGTNPSTGTLSGTAQVTAVAGVATFPTLNINKVGTGYTLGASATGLTATTSNAFNILVGTAAKLAFTIQPSSLAAGASIAPAVAVGVEDAAGNVVPSAANQITIAIGTNPSSGTLSGTAQVNAVAGVAAFSTLSINKVGTGYTLAASATGLTAAVSNTFNVTAGTASKLVFTAQPTNATAGAAISPSVQVTIEDSQSNVVTTATTPITIAIGTNPSSGTLSGTAQVNAVSGVATFATLSINNAGSGYTLGASATGLTSTTSTAFNIQAGAAAKLAITTQPTNAIAGAAINPAVQVTVEDTLGNTVTTAINQITIAIGTNPSSGTLSGTAQVNAVAGVATFSTLSINKSGNGYTLGATATALTPAASSAFNVTAGIASKLAFAAEPVNTVAGSNIAPAVTVSVEDQFSNLVTTASNSITVAIGTNPSSGTLSGTATAIAVNGVATFSTLNINNTGTGYTLTASASGLTGATSTAFNIVVSIGPPAKLVFSVQPSSVVAGVSIAPAIQVTVEDAGGNQVPSATNQITIAIGTNPSSGTLSGTLVGNAVSGVATFSTLSINNAGTGYTLGASASGLTSATSSAFNVTAGVASKLGFNVQPTGVTAGNSITPAVQVSVQDSLGNLVSSATNQITIAIGTNPSSGTLGGTAQVNAVAGVATFSTLNINKSGAGYTLSASASGLTGATSSAFNVTAGGATKLAFTVQPSNVAAGTSISPAVAVSVEDAQGNVVTTAVNQITVAIGTNPSSGILGGTAQVNAVAGVATFSSLSINNTGNGYTLSASASSLAGDVSNAFNVTANCTNNCSISGTVSGPQIAGVTVTLSGGPSSPAPATTNSSGNYSFGGLTQGTYTITPTLAGYTFNPSAPSISIGATTVQNFVSTSALTSFSISGTVSYGGVKTGRVFIRVYPNGCTTGCNALAGTSIAAANGAYTVRGLLPQGGGGNGDGSYVLNAEIDTLGTGLQNASNPTGNSAVVTITNVDISGIGITVTDPAPLSPVTPSNLGVAPTANGAVVQYQAPRNANGIEIATAYKVYYGTDVNATNGVGSPKTFVAQGTHQDVLFFGGLTNGATNFKMTSLVGATESAPTAVFGPVTIGATTGARTISGSVTFPGTATGPLYVGVFGGSSGNSVYVERIPTPASSPVAYSISGVPDGTYQNFAILDQNQDGEINIGDLDNVNGNNTPTVTVSGSNVTGADLDLTSDNVPAIPMVSTSFQQGNPNPYSLNLRIQWGLKRPVAMTLISGPNVAVPFDMGVDEHQSIQTPNFLTAPQVGDTYQFQILFSDATTQTLSASVSAVFGASNVAQSLAVNTSLPNSTTVPLFSWSAPAVHPTTYYYGICVFNQNGASLNWCDFGNNGPGIPSSQTSDVFNSDGSASSPNLTSGTTYDWNVFVQDANQNTAQTSSTYTVP